MVRDRQFGILNIVLPILIVFFFVIGLVFQHDERYLYDSNFLHANGYLILGLLYPVGTIIAFISNNGKIKFFLSVVFLNAVVVLLVLFAFEIIPSKSVTNDINNYKKFDLLVQNDVSDFFPDHIENFEVIKYDYFYANPYHHVYNVYLEIEVSNDFDEFISQYRTEDCVERIFKYDENFFELVFVEDIDYNNEKDQILRGNIQKILFSPADHIVIFEYFQSWSYCAAEDIYYFERFNMEINAYSSYLESLIHLD